jgi:ribosomal protein S18 acetylase RimI-like enzyme
VDDVVLRTATTDDVEALIAFWAYAGENDGRPTDRPALVSALLDRDPDALIVATVDDRVVGTVIAGWDGWRAHLYRLAVHPDHRRRGIGRRLLARAEERLVALGATRIDAMVLDGNGLGAATWAAAGYDRQRDWSRWVKPVRPPRAGSR